MASSKPIPCGPCIEGKVNNKADIWCYNCVEGLCSTCSGHHKRSKSSLDHKTIDIKSYKPSFPAITTECDKHGQQFNSYCPSHLMPCCSECISKFHSKCTGIKSLTSVAKKTKIQKSKESVEEDINSILHLLKKIVKNKSTNIKIGKQQCEDIKKSIHKIREKMNKHLDHLEEKLCQETDNVRYKEKSTARDFISEVKGKKKKMKDMKEYLHAVTTNTSKLQSFLGVHQIEQQVHQCQQYVEELEKDDRAKEFEMKMKQNDEIETILNKLESLESLGEVTVVKVETAMKRETTCVRRKAQVQSREQSNINNMTMDIETQKKTNKNGSISDIICLMDGRVILVVPWRIVYQFTSDGELQKELPIPPGAFSVTQINQNTIAISYPKEKDIKIFNMENEKVTKVITLDKACRGLAFSNNSLAVGLNNNGDDIDYDREDDDDDNDREIRIIELDGKTLKSIQVKIKSQLYNLVYCNDRVIYSDSKGEAVYCYDGSGKQMWRYKLDLESPRGLCTDTYGNIIVADYFSDKIIVISKDGQDSKVLISIEEDGLEEPQCICFKHNESAGFICDRYGKYLAKFNLSYK